MVLPVADAMKIPCLTNNMNPVARQKLKEKYRFAKQYGIKSAWGVVTGVGVAHLAVDVVKGVVVQKGKEKVIPLILLGCSHVGLGVVPLITNSTRVVSCAQKIHSVTSSIYRCAHDASEIPMVALDFLLFGEYISSCPENGYQFLNVSSDALDQIANLNN